MTKLINKKSNFYSQKKEVMKYVYEAKNIASKYGINHDRIEIKITNNSSDCIALATINSSKKTIWITEQAIIYNDLRQTVFHEILHTLYNIEHVNGCPIMHPTRTKNKYSNKEITSVFIKYILLNK